jgi:hypothetical protein
MATIRDKPRDPTRASSSTRPPRPTGLFPWRICRFVPAISATPRHVSATHLLKPEYDIRSTFHH